MEVFMPKPHRHLNLLRRSRTRYVLLLGAFLAVAVSAATAAGAWRHDSKPPTTPSNLRVASATSSSVLFRWNASTDDTGVAGYLVSSATRVDRLKPSTLYDTLSGLTCGSSTTVNVVAYDRAGNRSAPATCSPETSPVRVKRWGKSPPATVVTRRLAKPRPVQGEQAPPRRPVEEPGSRRDGWSPSTESGLQACYGKPPHTRGFSI